MGKAKISVLFSMMFLIAVGSPAIASAEGPIAGSGTSTFSYTQVSPPDFGPYEYYGFEVWLVYAITIHWSSVTYTNGDVRQTLTASGTVDIYEDQGLSNLVDARSCSASLSFYDAGGDACIGEPGGFYEVDWNSLENMERLNHFHQVSGVYTRRAWVRNGVGAGKGIAFTHPPTILTVSE